jgi:undecaprenyl-diphosphatase
MNHTTDNADLQVDESERADPERLWSRRAISLIGVLLFFRLIYAVIVPVDLVADEAYYWDWSRQLDWGYYSKPPMIAWLIALSTSLGGSTTFVVRLPAVVLATAGLLFTFALARRLYGAKAGFWVTTLCAAAPGNAALGLLMTIDAPLLFCWCASLYCIWRFLARRADRGIWLVLAITTTGLGILSKQTMLGFIPLTAFFLLTSPEDRGELRKCAFWLWAVITPLFLTPVLWWNSHHGWITAEHTRSHFAGESVGLLKRISQCAEFMGGQLGVASPVTCVLYAAISALGILAFWRLPRRERFLLWFSGIPMLGVLGLSLLQRVQPNWPAPFYPAGIILVAGWALGQVPSIRPLKSGERTLRRAAVVGVVAVLVTCAVPFGLGLQGTKLDLVARLRGWKELGDVVGARRAQLPTPEKTFVVTDTGRATASELAFYMPRQPRVYLWNGSDVVVSQYDIWGGPSDKRGWDALIVTHPSSTPPSPLCGAFASVRPVGRVHVPIGAGRSHTFQLWRGTGFGEWPDARLVSQDGPTRR